ncbi:MAG TPA: hypothetical protein DE179_09810 [Oceanospirillaceae bacterium]|nr:hypothetical protein [Oceanospirillaceae bacterium]
MEDISQTSIGILMLESQFPRFAGDIGNPDTWPFPVHYEVVEGASPKLAVSQSPEQLLTPFIAAGQRLVAKGACGITTSCGFLSLFQTELSNALQVPVATSALMQANFIQTFLPSQQTLGIITIDSSSLTKHHLQAANVPTGTPVVGTQNGHHFRDAILNNTTQLNYDAALQDMYIAAEELLSTHPNTGAILLECTNMVPYATALKKRFELPVYSIHTLISWFQAGLQPPSFARPSAKMMGLE